MSDENWTKVKGYEEYKSILELLRSLNIIYIDNGLSQDYRGDLESLDYCFQIRYNCDKYIEIFDDYYQTFIFGGHSHYGTGNFNEFKSKVQESLNRERL